MSTALIAIDETHLASRLISTFKDAGLGVVCVRSGVEAYRVAGSIQPDLVIADYRLADLGGLELCTRLANNPATRDIPVILLTANGFGTPHKSSLPNVKRVLTKPVSPQAVLRLAHGLLRSQYCSV